MTDEIKNLQLQLAAARELIVALGEAGQQFMEVIDFGAQSKEWLVLNAALFIRCRKAMEAFEKANAPTAEVGQAGDTPKPPATKA